MSTLESVLKTLQVKGVSKNGDISEYLIWSIKWQGLKSDIIGVLSHQ